MDPDGLAAAAPRLVDTTAREELLEALRSLAEDEVAQRAGLAYAMGYASLVKDDQDSGIQWLARARAALRPDDWLLRARINFEIGAVYLSRGSRSPADVLLLEAQGERSGASGDRLHLQALADEAQGDYRRAITNYRKLLQGDTPVLSPATRVLAMINLAAACNQRDPAESLALSELALATIAAQGLHTRLRAPVLNIMGFAQICIGELAQARATLGRATAESQASGHRRIEFYAEFNQGIIDELSGALSDSVRRLQTLRESARKEHPDLAGWSEIRLAWLRWLLYDRDAAVPAESAEYATLRSARYADAVRCLIAFADSRRGRTAQAIVGFAACVRSAEVRGDLASAFALLIQLAHLEHVAGRSITAKRHAERALAMLEASSFRLSPNWWSAEAFDTFVAIAPRAATTGLFAPPRLTARPAERHDVQIHRDGTVLVDGVECRPTWTTGRTGSRMLLRLFKELLSRHPQSMARDSLADLLWPDSEGDAAVHNLYAATNDLRKILADVPGVRVRVDAGCYRLVLDPNVRLLPH